MAFGEEESGRLHLMEPCPAHVRRHVQAVYLSDDGTIPEPPHRGLWYQDLNQNQTPSYENVTFLTPYLSELPFGNTVWKPRGLYPDGV